MPEKDEGFLPGLPGNPLGPVAEVSVAIVRTTQAQVSARGGRHERNLQLVVGVGQAKGGVVLSQNGKDFVIEPRLMPKLQRGRAPTRQYAEKIAQAEKIFAKKRRHLK